jgi:NitT/TauT family transport system substrate-binding protein
MQLGLQAWATALVCTAIGIFPLQGKAQSPQDVVVALPTATLTFSAAFLAQDGGFFKEERLNASLPVLVGVASVNAVINGSADFTIGTGPVFLRAAAHGQRLLAIANLSDRPNIELVLRKDVAEALKFDDRMSLSERGRLLKGKTIAIQGVGSIVHAWERLVAARGGLDPETDVRIAPMEPPSMLAALETKAVDGYVTSLPYTTEAVLRGSAVMFASAAQGAAPDILPFAAGLVIAKPETCRADRDKCLHVVRALARSVQLIRDRPDEALRLLRVRFKEMNAALLETAWPIVAQAYTKDLRVAVRGLENSEKVNIEAKLLDPKDKVSSYDGLFTDEFLP